MKGVQQGSDGVDAIGCGNRQSAPAVRAPARAAGNHRWRAGPPRFAQVVLDGGGQPYIATITLPAGAGANSSKAAAVVSRVDYAPLSLFAGA